MTMRQRAAMLLAAVLAAAGLTLAGATPAQAFVNFHGCDGGYLCLYDGTGWTGTKLSIPANVLMSRSIPLDGSAGYNFNNRTGSAVNHTLMDIYLAQYPDCFGATWRIDAFHTANFSGRWFNGRASCANRVP